MATKLLGRCQGLFGALEYLTDLIGLPAQQVARLAIECFAEGGERREAHCLCAAVLEYRQVRGRDPYAVRELADGHLPPAHHPVDADGDRHKTPPPTPPATGPARPPRAKAGGG